MQISDRTGDISAENRAGARAGLLRGGWLRHQYLSPRAAGRRGACNPWLQAWRQGLAHPSAPAPRRGSPGTGHRSPQGQGQHNPRIDGETEAQAEERSEPQGLQRERAGVQPGRLSGEARSSRLPPLCPGRPPAPGPGHARWLSTCTRVAWSPCRHPVALALQPSPRAALRSYRPSSPPLP